MIDTSSANIEILSAHHTGNKTNDEDLTVSKSPIDIEDVVLREMLLKYFLSSFKSPEMFSLTFTNSDFKLNPLYNFASRIFDAKDEFHFNSVNIAKHLYETSLHPNIKAGDFYVVYFSQVKFEGQFCDAIGLFKSENKQPFLKLTPKKDGFSLNYEDGISIEKLDKGCLILDANRDEGYRVCIVDRGNRAAENNYWRDGFLMLKPCEDEYHQTNNFLTITKKFVTGQLPEEMNIEKADQINLLNKSVDYFKKNERFEQAGFEEEVLGHPDVIKSFRKFENQYSKEHNIELPDDFEISTPALKKQARVFKSVLKLDKNFHIYIHGDRDLIEKGVDPDTGKKFYKIYFDKED